MLRWERGEVSAERAGWQGVQRLEVRLGEGTGSETVRALSYPDLVGVARPGDAVLLNTNALRRGLGTGGEALVVALPDRLPQVEEISGHMVKARYTPLQTMVDAVDDPAGEHYEVVRDAASLDSMPVVVADLHSSLPAIAAGLRASSPGARIVHVHTDAAALPAAYSRTAAVLRSEGLLEATISAGQAFGGDLEAVTVHSALLAARHVLHADAVIVVQGPGNLGTGTGWGFSGVQAAEAVHAAHVLHGRPIAALRVSEADARDRHRGLSHHSSTMVGSACLAPVHLPVLDPADTAYSGFHASVTRQVQASIIDPAAARGLTHRLIEIGADGLDEALRRLPVTLSTMGRGLDEDHASFLYAALAGRAAALLLSASDS